ncbi:MAG: response regulator [Alphaproteobacteria bacterium]|nr:response regulator [Alphaproteobacteria bacterium]
MSDTILIPDAALPPRGVILNAIDPSQQESITRRRGKLIFCVDDDHNIRQIVKHSLAEAGYPVLVARDGPTCLALLARYEPRVILLDIEMPEMDGLQTLLAMRQRFPDRRKTRIVFLTGRRTVADVMAARENGADDYIIKPFTRANLIRRLDHWTQMPTTGL